MPIWSEAVAGNNEFLLHLFTRKGWAQLQCLTVPFLRSSVKEKVIYFRNAGTQDTCLSR